MSEHNGVKYRPFEVLQDMVKRGDLKLQTNRHKLKESTQKVNSSGTEEQAFLNSMASGTVKYLGWSTTPLKLRTKIDIPVWGEEGEESVLRELSSFISGKGEMDPFKTGEGFHSTINGNNTRLISMLKQGKFSVQADLDLHGYQPSEAREVLETFLTDSKHRSLSCVRIIHGRGKHSGQEPHVIKQVVKHCLSSKKWKRIVIAYASARWKDGGSGAVYVLLSRKISPPQR